VEALCRVLAVARSGFYAWGWRPPGVRAQQNQRLVTQIRTCYQAARGRYRKLPHQGDSSEGELLASDVGPITRQFLIRADDFFDGV
jgi:hypothetical protein